MDELLDLMADSGFGKLPESGEVYLVSEEPWSGSPTADCVPLYTGRNTGNSKRFRTRIGELIAHAFGFFENAGGHHSGGESLHHHCLKTGRNPKSLYIAWTEGCECSACTELALYLQFRQTLLNKARPGRCSRHSHP